jgi:hypothetical protein
MGRGLFLADRNSHSDHIANLALWGTAVLEGHNAQFAANLRLGAARLPLWHLTAGRERKSASVQTRQTLSLDGRVTNPSCICSFTRCQYGAWGVPHRPNAIVRRDRLRFR